MPIKYSIYQDPPRRDGKAAARHIQVKDLEAIRNKGLAEEMSNEVYSRGTIAGVLVKLSEELPELLAQGNTIHIDGIGTFTPKVSGVIKNRKKRNGTMQVTATALRVSGIDFQPSDKLLRAINAHAKFERQPERRMTDVSDEDLRAFLARHFSTHADLRRSDLVDAFNISKDRARTYLLSLVADGTLTRQGSRGTSCYVINKE